MAEACETMLTDTDAAQRIGKTLQAKDATLFEKVKQWFRDLAAKLREAYKGLNPDSQIARYAKKTIQQVDGLVQLWADMAVDAAENYREGTGNENAELDSGVKMQLRYADGNSVVWIEENILKENDGEPVHQYIANYIAEHIGEVYTIIESGQKVYIGEDLPGEYTQSKYTKAILKNNAKVLKAKNRAAANLGEMIEIATYRRWEETKHTHSKDAKYGIYRYDMRFGFPIKNHQGNVASANVYNAELLIRNASDGKKYLYDIVSIKKDTASSDWLTKKAASAAANAAGQKGDVSRNSIRNPEQVVNKKFSMRDNVEETKDLIAVHNLSEEKLLKSLNLGGLPMPSIAILRAKDGHNKFGDISLVFSKDTIDPELSRVNKVYSADAWTPTYPKIDYKANDRVEDRISSKYNELVK